MKKIIGIFLMFFSTYAMAEEQQLLLLVGQPSAKVDVFTINLVKKTIERRQVVLEVGVKKLTKENLEKIEKSKVLKTINVNKDILSIGKDLKKKKFYEEKVWKGSLALNIFIAESSVYYNYIVSRTGFTQPAETLYRLIEKHFELPIGKS